MPKKEVLPPGAKAPYSGEYEVISPRGGHTGTERTVVRGKPLPPTEKPGMGYELDRPAHNGAGRRRK
jgi:hypothetical protein